MSKPELVVLGIDGASFSILDPLLAEGYLPNLASLREQAAWGPLDSVVPPVTAPAWSSFMTGCLPQKHGVFGFEYYDLLTGSLQVVSASTIKVRRLWDWLNDYGKTVGVINLPVTYPPSQLDGYMISGFLTPPEATEVSYPPELLAQVRAALGDYIINIPIAERTALELSELIPLLEQLQRVEELRFRAFLHLLESRPTDVMICVFMVIDRIQHLFGSCLDPGSPTYWRASSKPIRDLLIPCYQQLDSYVGQITDRLSSTGTLLIVSDHGFGGLRRTFYVNNWLEQQGYLVLDARRLNAAIRQSTTESRGPGAVGRTKVSKELLESAVDWSKTKAVGSEVFSQGIVVNLQGREPYGVVKPGYEHERICNELEAGLMGIKDPLTGEQIIDRVIQTRKFYGVETPAGIPDLHIVIDAYATILSPAYLLTEQRQIIRDNTSPIGFHTQQGIFFAHGPMFFPQNNVQGTKIIDLCPLILHLLEIPIPTRLDGLVPRHILKREWLEQHEVVLQELPIEASTLATPITQQQTIELMTRLRQLGYLS